MSGAVFDTLDQIANLEFKTDPAARGGTALRYRTARQAQGGEPICGRIAEVLQPRLQGGGTVALATGTGNPIWLPHGETDGPSGIAVLARALAGLGVRSCLLAEERFLAGIAASVRSAGVPLLEEDGWRRRDNAALALAFPTGAAAGRAFVDALFGRLPDLAAVVFLEKPGPNAHGAFHNSSGAPKDPAWLAHAHLLAPACRERAIPTIGVGDGGNEIGFGRIREALQEQHPPLRDCRCPCGGGLLDATDVDVLFPAAVSNWGGYAIAAALALASGRPALMPAWEAVARSIAAPIEHGAFDGYSGLAVATVDGTSPAANRAIYALMLEALRLATVPAAQARS